MEKVDKLEYKILGTTLWKICTYFIIYSFVGYIIETIYGLITSRSIRIKTKFSIWTFSWNLRYRSSFYIIIFKIF